MLFDVLQINDNQQPLFGAKICSVTDIILSADNISSEKQTVF